MKKFLGLIVLALFVCLPLGVNATISAANGMKCDSTPKKVDGKNVVECTFSLATTANESISTFTIDLIFNDSSNITLDESSVKGSGAFNAVVAGNTISFNAATPQTGEKIELGTFKYYVADLAKDCGFKFVPTDGDIDEPIVVPVNPENPKTGSAISYIALAAGVILVAGAYVVSRKNTKMYKI